ncbi:MAG: hypothetical protein ACKODX_12220 [Gemmata sp.]
MYGIYKLPGGTLTTRAVPSDKPADRPEEFKTAPGDKRVVLTLNNDWPRPAADAGDRRRSGARRSSGSNPRGGW